MLTAGPHANVTLDTETLEVEYLQEAGWDVNTCTPSKEKLTELGLEDLVPMLHG